MTGSKAVPFSGPGAVAFSGAGAGARGPGPGAGKLKALEGPSITAGSRGANQGAESLSAGQRRFSCYCQLAPEASVGLTPLLFVSIAGLGFTHPGLDLRDYDNLYMMLGG